MDVRDSPSIIGVNGLVFRVCSGDRSAYRHGSASESCGPSFVNGRPLGGA